MQVVGNMVLAGTVGEKVALPDFDYRTLDWFVTDHYYYEPDPYMGQAQDAYSTAGKFVVINYSVRNSSTQTVAPNLSAVLHARAGDKVEFYEESEDVEYSRTGSTAPELAPRQITTQQFIFDVPQDVEPEIIAVSVLDDFDDPIGDAGAIDLTKDNPQGPSPEEILALQWEYTNMTAWEQAYELFAEETKNRVTLEQYKSGQESGPTDVVADYSFPSVSVEGDRATIEWVMTVNYPDDYNESQEQATQEAVLEDEGWRILMRDDQYEYYLGEGGETTG